MCIQGTHPKLLERTKPDSNLAKAIHDARVKVETYKVQLESHPQFVMTPLPRCQTAHAQETPNVKKHVHLVRETQEKIDQFVLGEELGTEITPRCGGCRCGKCPFSGHTYSFKEEQELRVKFVKIWSMMNPINAG